jgi:predicted  nucleic acid-binding Zn ribbon protein
MSSINRGSNRNERPLQKLAGQAAGTAARQMRTCPACNKEFTLDEYLDHVYDNDDCYKAYLASEKKEMSKQ